MVEFLYGDHLNSAIVDVIGTARQVVFIVSPFIRLHSRIKDEFLILKEDPNVAIRIFFGKNKEDKFKSLQEEDLEFFKQFPNVEIRYDERLHAKYYSNEKLGILCSMNLYDFSQNNNVEAGVISKGESFDRAAFEYFNELFVHSKLLLKREPSFKNKLLGLTKTYEGSKTTVDNISKEFEKINATSLAKPEINIGYKSNFNVNLIMGYCIRTRKPIPLNIKKPYCSESYSNWALDYNPKYPENYDHFTGEDTQGETCFERPVLRKNWSAFQLKLKEVKK